ncbi:MAG: c-type cytochrome [Bacteroidia bacterium]|nr:c-type cytochrome [Bacteroidia bacterium]
MKIDFYRHISVKFLVLSFLLFICIFPAFSQPDGESLFKTNCTQCHSIGKGIVIGPDLKDVQKRRPEDWIIKWVHNSSAMIKAGDAYGIELFNKFNKVAMTSFNLKDDEVKAVLAYIKTEGEKAPLAKPAAFAQGGAEKQGGNTFLYLLIAAVVLFLITTMMKRIQHAMEKAVRNRKGLPEPVHLKRWEGFVRWSRHNKKLLAVILIFLSVMGSVKGWYALAAIGINQNYQPDQPIAFSHKIHAGDNAINCKYCHFGAEKGKTAGIPPASVCMNCHKYIKEGTLTGKDEIAKIYKALDYNPETQVYGPNKKPIQWTRVHNLPDLTYFNHSQHVTVAGVECQTCHGPMQEETVANQFAPLTMGWCIDCHRTTPVKMAGNHYYDDYHKELLKKWGSDSLITVERIGGTECARCHY